MNRPHGVCQQSTCSRDACPGRLVRPRSSRKGGALVIALVLLTVASLLGIVVVRSVIAHARQLQRTPWRLQAEALAEAGLNRAAAQLRVAPDYTGETWQIPAAELGEHFAARVEIRRDAAGLTVTVLYPDRATDRVQLTRTLP